MQGSGQQFLVSPRAWIVQLCVKNVDEYRMLLVPNCGLMRKILAVMVRVAPTTHSINHNMIIYSCLDLIPVLSSLSTDSLPEGRSRS